MEPFQHEGLWWDPNEPDRRWAGTLRFDPRSEISLALIAEVRDPREIVTRGENYERLFGVTPGGTALTLMRCHERKSTGIMFGLAAPRAIELRANTMIVGFHAESSDPLLTSASVVFRSANEWRGHMGFGHDNTVSRPNMAIHYNGTDPIVLHDDGLFRYSLRTGLSGGLGGRSKPLPYAPSEIERSRVKELIGVSKPVAKKQWRPIFDVAKPEKHVNEGRIGFSAAVDRHGVKRAS